MTNLVLKHVLYMTKLCTYAFLIQCLFMNFLFANNGNAQVKSIEEVMVRIALQNESIENAFKKIEKASHFNFVYTNKDVKDLPRISLGDRNMSIYELLTEISLQTKLEFKQINRSILVQKSKKQPLEEPVTVLNEEVTVSGVVTDDSGSPIPGATVSLQGSSIGTATDIDGRYSITVPEGSTLVFSFIGFVSQSISIGDRSVVDVVLIEDMASLDEVVVVGYGVQKKVNLTGAVDAISAKDVVSRPVGQASTALQGLAPGVTVTQRSGKPGADGGTIRIRGIGTLGNSNPLVLVDGVPMSINNLDVNEIESISILKDAASAAIYGSRAANGVILVTTKRGTEGKFSISYRNSLGWQQPTALMKKVSGYDHMVMINEAFTNVGRNPTFSQEYIDAYRQNAPSDEYPETNWHDVMLKERAFQQNHYVSVNGGNEKMSILGSVSYMDQGGLMNSRYKRLNFRINSDIQVKDNLQIGLDVLARDDNRSEPPQQWYWLARYPHNIPGKNEDGSWGVGWDGQNGWATLEDGGLIEDKRNELMANIKLNWQPIEGFNLMLQAAPNVNYRHDKSFRKHVDLYYPDGSIVNPSPYRASLTEQYTKGVTNNYRAVADYGKNFQAHSLKLLAGVEAIDSKSEWIAGFRDQYPLENYDVLNVGSVANQRATGSAEEWALLSYFGRLNYNFNERYLLEVNLRADGSSRFIDENKFGFFPSLSAGWRMSEENFISQISWITELKLRGSWGTLGNQDIGNYPFSSAVTMGQNYVFGNDVPALGAALLYSGNPGITWETTKMANIGLDATLGNFDIVFDYYVKNTTDILLRLPTPRIAGLIEPFQNAGKVQNKGWDFNIGYRKRFGDWNFSVSGNLSDVENKIVDLVGTGPYIYAREIDMENSPYRSLYGLEALGYFQNQEEIDAHATQFGAVKPGDIKYNDINDDGIINAEDRVIIGNTIPKWTYGLNLSLDYKGFDFNLFGQGVGKVDGYLDNFATMAFFLGGTAQEWHKDHWTQENPNAAYPRLTFNYPNNEQVSSQWVRSAAYFRLKNLQLGYTLPQPIINRINISRLRVFGNGQNLLTLHKFYDSFDPEAPVGEGTFYPQVKVFVFGLEITL